MRSSTEGLRLERVVLLYRHGVRAPLNGEGQLDAVDGKPWPRWPAAASVLTAHGQAGVRLMGRYDRERLFSNGLFPATGCPRNGETWLHANTDQRTIASAYAWAEGFALHCPLAVDHLISGADDPLFHPIEAGAVEINGARAVAAINRESGGTDHLIRTHLAELDRLSAILGCSPGDSNAACHMAASAGRLSATSDGRNVQLSGPIMWSSGTAEVLLLQYAQGFPMEQVGWGRVDVIALKQMSSLHALLFDVYARPKYMASRVGGILGDRIGKLLQNPLAPKLIYFVGSDNNIVALAGLLGLHFQLAGYALDDPPLGGALGLEVWRDVHSGQRYVRVYYQAQSLDQLRKLTVLSLRTPPQTTELFVSGCGVGGHHSLCTLETFETLLHRGLNQL